MLSCRDTGVSEGHKLRTQREGKIKEKRPGCVGGDRRRVATNRVMRRGLGGVGSTQGVLTWMKKTGMLLPTEDNKSEDEHKGKEE